MAKTKVEVEIDDGWEIDGPIVLTGGCSGHGESYFKGRIRKAWQWPAWLKAPWIAMDKSGQWWAYSGEPKLLRHDWNAADEWHFGLCLTSTYSALFDFTPPPCDDWRQSKRKNPNL